MRCREKGRMLELAIYGLVGLATILVVTFYFAYDDEFSAAREQSSFDPIDKANLNVTSFLVGSRIAHLGIGLSEQEKNDIVVFLRIGNVLVAKRAWEKPPDNLKYAIPTRFVPFH
jgi:hypothetical protein